MAEEMTMTAGAVEVAGETAENAAATAEVVAPQAETAPATEQQATVDTTPASVESKPAQNRGKNAQMKELRQKAEAHDSMAGGIMAYARSQGLQPVDATQALQMLQAKAKGVSLEQHLQEERDAASKQEEMVRNHPLFKEMEQRAAQNEANASLYNANQQMQADLEAIQAVDPSVTSLESIEGYTDMVKQGVTGLNAYYALKGQAAVKAAATPPAVGAVGAPGDTDRDFTSEELDRLNKELDDPNILKRAIRSIQKLK